MNISRFYSDLNPFLEAGKVLIIYGPRQVGKTTLLGHFLEKTHFKYLLDNGDNISTQHLLGSQSKDEIMSYIEGYDLIAIDEAQKIPHIGTALKIIVDHAPRVRVIATGSSSFALAGEVGEPLTGRKITLTLYPFAQIELKNQFNTYELKKMIEKYLIFGSYPDIVTAELKDTKIRKITELKDSYLLKDILELDRIKNSKLLVDLLRLLAFQVGSEVSHNELGMQLGTDYKTIGRYLDLLEKSFVIFNVRGFSKNLRKEITKKSKYYFYDTGMRNAIIANFNDLSLRNDVGALWENFIYMERVKKLSYQNTPVNFFFWRTWDHKEIDMIEEREGKLFAYEFKWKAVEKKISAPKNWVEAYPDSSFQIIHNENYLSFIT